MAISERLLDYAKYGCSPSLFSLNLCALASEHRPVHADPADLKRFQEVQRVIADEQFGGLDPGRAFRRRQRVGPVAGR